MIEGSNTRLIHKMDNGFYVEGAPIELLFKTNEAGLIIQMEYQSVNEPFSMNKNE